MSVVELSLVLMLLLFAILGSGVWIAIALAVCGFAAVLTKVATPAGQVLATSMWTASNSWDLTALPMFIWMGEILYRTKLSDDMFEGLAPWLQKLPGRLLHVNVIGCAIFAAVSGSSAATCATIGRIALPELLKRGYDEKHGDRHAGRLRHAWTADPALDHHDRLCHRDRPVDRAAVHRRRHSGNHARRPVHGLHRGVGAVQPNAHAAARTAGPVSRRVSTRRVGLFR